MEGPEYNDWDEAPSSDMSLELVSQICICPTVTTETKQEANNSLSLWESHRQLNVSMATKRYYYW